MSAFAVFLIPAGIIAGLICFRWLRTLAMVIFAVTIIWFLASCAPPGTHYEPFSITPTPNAQPGPAWSGVTPQPPNPELERRRQEITKCVLRMSGTPQRYSGQIYELCASHGTGPYWAW